MRTAKPIRVPALGMREDQLLGAEDPRYADSIRNLEHDPEGYWEPAPGTVQVGTWGGSSGVGLGLVWFNPRPGLRWLVIERALNAAQSELRYVNWPVGGSTQITTRRRVANGEGGQFLEFGRFLYHFNGLEQPIRWDGRRVVPVGFILPPPSPMVRGADSLALNDRAGVDTFGATWAGDARTQQRGPGEYPASADAPWRYGYALSYVNDLGQESPVSPIVWVSGVNVTGEPPGIWRTVARISSEAAPSHIRAVRLWRTRNTYNVTGTAIDSAAQLYLHSSFETGGRWDLVDLLSDSDLGLPYDPDAVGYVPANPSVAAFWQNTLWLAAEGRLHYSSPLFPEQFPAINVLPIGSPKTGRIVALFPIARGLVVWTEQATFIVKGTPADGYTVETLSARVGCAARNSIEVIAGVGVAWLAESGPQLLVGLLEDDQPTAVRPIPGLRKTWRNTHSRLRSAFAIHDPVRKHVWWHIAEGGNTRPTFGIVWHYGIDSWSLRPSGDWPIAGATSYLGRTYVISHDDSTAALAGVHLLTRGSSSRFGTSITANNYYSGPIRGDDRTVLQQLVVHVIGQGDATFTAQYRRERAVEYTNVADTDRELQHAESDRDKWSTGLWGAAYRWADAETAEIRLSLFQAHAFAHQFRFRGDRMRIIAFEVFPDPHGGPLSVPWLER